MAFSQQDIETLQAAIASGLKRVEYQDRTVVYQDIDAMSAELDKIEKKITPSTSDRQSRARFSRE